MNAARFALLATVPAAASPALAQCGDWQSVSSPNPSDVINVFTDSDLGPAGLHALLIADDDTNVGNAVTPHVLRRVADGWTDLGGPGADGPSGVPTYFALHAAGDGRLWLGGVGADDPSLQADPAYAVWDGAWAEPVDIDLGNQVIYPYRERGAEIRAIDTAPDGTVFAVGTAKGYGLSDDSAIPLFLVNSGSGWQEVTQVGTDWPGGFSPNTVLTDVIAFSASNVWAVGRHAPEDGQFGMGGLIMHWDGASLSIAQDPRQGGDFIDFPLRAMAAGGPDDIWAVGGSVFNPQTSAIAHYDGQSWTRVESPVDLPLHSIAMHEDGTAWASSVNFGSDLASFDGQSWSAVAPPRPDANSVTMSRGADGAVWMLGETDETDSLAQVFRADMADMNRDGVLDLEDVQSFIAAFVAQSPDADVAEPFGVLDLGDAQAFVASFGAGCS